MIQELELTRFVDVDFTQARANYDNGVIMEYAALYQDLAFYLPPIEAERVPNSDKFWIIDGHHRFKAAEMAGRKTIEAEIWDSCQSKEEALAKAATRNADHGLPRTVDDKRKAVKIFLLYGDPELPDYAIGGRVGVSAKLVTAVRQEMEESGEIAPRETPKNKAAKAIADPENAGKSNREIAEAAGVDEKTVRKLRKNGKAEKSAPEPVEPDPEMDVLNEIALKAKEFCDRKWAEEHPDEPEDYDQQTRPSIAKVTSETRRVVPDVEKPSEPVVVHEYDMAGMIGAFKVMTKSKGKFYGKLNINVDDDLNDATAKIIAVFDERVGALNVIYAKLQAWLDDRGNHERS